MSNMTSFAENELRIIGMLGGSGEDMNEKMSQHILKMIGVFAEEGHSGFSASYAVGCLEKLLRFEPLSPLTGEESEWTDLSEYGETDMTAQNKRCGRVFKRADSTAYDSEAVVFRDPDGACFTSRESRRDITFPYTPKREYVDRPDA